MYLCLTRFLLAFLGGPFFNLKTSPGHVQVYLNLYKSSIHPPQPWFTITLHPNYSIALWNIYNNISISKLNFLKLRNCSNLCRTGNSGTRLYNRWTKCEQSEIGRTKNIIRQWTPTEQHLTRVFGKKFMKMLFLNTQKGQWRLDVKHSKLTLQSCKWKDCLCKKTQVLKNGWRSLE